MILCAARRTTPRVGLNLLTYLLTNSPSHSKAANHYSTSQEMHRILWNPKVHYRVYTCPYPKPDQSSQCPHPTPWRSILILSSHLRRDLPSCLLPSGFPTKTLYSYTRLLSPIPATCPTHLILDLINRTTFGEQYRTLNLLLVVQLHTVAW